MVNRTFPFRLHALLDQAYDWDIHGESDIISWTPSGKSFKIHDVEAFISCILPKYFPKQSQLKSFKRQLQYYGFSNFGWEHFGHPYFLRRQRELVSHLKHKKSSRRNQAITVQPSSSPTPRNDPFEASLNDSARPKALGLPLNRERLPTPTINVAAPPAFDPLKIPPNLKQELCTLAYKSNIQTLLNRQRLMDLMLSSSMSQSLTSRSAAGFQALNHLMAIKTQKSDLLCHSVAWQLRLALVSSTGVPDMRL